MHEKAVQYFQRGLKLNPSYLSAWTLMGHEFIELKNTNAAIQSYRRAIGELLLDCENVSFCGFLHVCLLMICLCIRLPNPDIKQFT